MAEFYKYDEAKGFNPEHVAMIEKYSDEAIALIMSNGKRLEIKKNSKFYGTIKRFYETNTNV